MEGYISREFTVWCGKCIERRQHRCSRKAVAEKHFREIGWRKTKKQGWVCTECYKKRYDNPDLLEGGKI